MFVLLFLGVISNETACVFMPLDYGWEKNGKSITILCYNLQENEKNLKEKLKELTDRLQCCNRMSKKHQKRSQHSRMGEKLLHLQYEEQNIYRDIAT